MKNTGNTYFEVVRERLPLALSLEDREPSSLTFGSFDRNFWAWKFTDFPGARFQEGACSLALLYKNNFEGNLLWKNSKALEWILAGFEHWTKIQRSDGSFDEAYPYERSLAATAFTSFYLGDAYLSLRDQVPQALNHRFIEVIGRAGQWLCKNDEKHGFLSNHLAAAAAALYCIYKITSEKRYLERSSFFLSRIFSAQSPEGWFEEYGGADIGYLTHCMFFLSKIWMETRDQELFDRLLRAVEFLAYFIHPDGSIGGEYASRNTEFYFPAALEILAPFSPMASAISGFMRTSIKANSCAGLASMDSYNFFPMLNNYLYAGFNIHETDLRAELPFRSNFTKYFMDAGILLHSNDRYHSILGISKGGVLKTFDKARGIQVDSDCGFWGQIKSGHIYTSQAFDRGRAAVRSADAVSFETYFTRKPTRTFTPGLFLVFRSTVMILRWLPHISYFFKNLLVKALIRQNEPFGPALRREVIFEKDRVVIADVLKGLKKANFVKFARAVRCAAIHMGSSKYFKNGDLRELSAEHGELGGEITNEIILKKVVSIP